MSAEGKARIVNANQLAKATGEPGSKISILVRANVLQPDMIDALGKCYWLETSIPQLIGILHKTTLQ